ncbi:ABC transporter permease [Natronobacterium texcoconense]|uniref:Peptide/nickel transport system permease protein n=1 Tax=Natronobacterium texcoconense TaxID=1095778 RepID=A0A1H0YWQ5_NATTX|nr:ABC transporter permease [Natronobacterium texcoconense]SDQ19632.1 peptide/nickel transport system permease protein [Natronobacterium texcoconense]
MTFLRILAKRFVAGLVTAWAVLTTVFLAFSATEDWVASRIEGRIRHASGGFDPIPEEELEQQLEEAMAQHAGPRDLDRPLRERYVDWMGNMATFDWGYSHETGEAVFPLVMSATARTATYVLPAIVLAVALGMAIGLYAALRPESRLADSSRIGSYVLFAAPGFWIGGLLLSSAQEEVIGPSPLLFDHVLPIVLVAVTLLGGYVSYSRAHALEYAAADFVTLVEAKGGGPLLVARHVVRNAAIPLFSMLFTEALGLLVIGIFVIEVLFGIEGFGLTFFFAIDARDVPVLLGSTMVIIAVGILGNIVQDLSYQFLDPRVDG